MSELDEQFDDAEDVVLEEKYAALAATVLNWISLLADSPKAMDSEECAESVICYLDARIAEEKAHPKGISRAREILGDIFTEDDKRYAEGFSGAEMVQIVQGLAENILLELLINRRNIDSYLAVVTERIRKQVHCYLKQSEG